MRRPRTVPACSNSEPGTFNHECGRPAIWRGFHRNGHVQLFCDACHCTGHEAAFVVRWEPIKLDTPPPPPGMFSDVERDQLDWITEGL